MTEEYLTIAECAQIARVGIKTIYHDIAKGDLKAARVNGRDYRVRRAWVDEWMLRSVETGKD